jgi:RimJ/RimL family protein N-acetyltransferase
MERYAGREPLWRFPDVPPSRNLVFERLRFDNREVVLEMFERDDSPFVDHAFKAPDRLYTYVAAQWISAPYSPKHGAADWIVRTRQQEPVGLLHVYDVSRETWALNNRRCSIGYVVAGSFRGSGLAQEAVGALQDHMFQTRDMLMLLAMPARANERSARFLVKLGYEERTRDYAETDKIRFFELYRDPQALRQMQHRFESN